MCLAHVSMSDASDRLRNLRVKKGYANASDAAKAFGWNEHTYKSHENGIRGIRPDQAKKYATAFGSTASHILYGTGSDSGGKGLTTTINHIANVPLVGRISAGVFRYEEGLFYENILVPAIPKPGVAAESQYAVVVDGASVNLRIPDGMYAICARLDGYPGGAQHGDLVHVVKEKAGLFEHTIKELRYGRHGRSLHPVSNDPRYQEEIKLADEGEEDVTVEIRGVVIGAYQPF